MLAYDEEKILERLSSMTADSLVLFAALCAERLVEGFRRWSRSSDSALEARRLESILDVIWDPEATADQLEKAAEEAAELVPDEDGVWTVEAGYAQSAAAAASYAASTRTSSGTQDAVWAARQVFEMADYAAQQSVEDRGFYTKEMEQELSAHPWVQQALRAIHDDLDAAARSVPSRSGELRAAARSEGKAWLTKFP